MIQLHGDEKPEFGEVLNHIFPGMVLDGLKMFNRVCRANGIKAITEVMQVSQISEMIDYVDVFQLGARISQNFLFIRRIRSC